MRAEEFITESPSPPGNGLSRKVKLSRRERAMKQVENMQEDEHVDEGWKDKVAAAALGGALALGQMTPADAAPQPIKSSQVLTRAGIKASIRL